MATLHSMKAVTPSQRTRWSFINSNKLHTAGTALLSKHVPYACPILSVKNSAWSMEPMQSLGERELIHVVGLHSLP